MSSIEIEISDQQSSLTIDAERLVRAVRTIVEAEGVAAATINVAIVDDPTIHDLNRRFLDHDEPTDVLSFVLGWDDERLEGDVIASADTAARSASEFGWSAADELLLYVVHGTLHLLGYDDLDLVAQSEMREREQHYLAPFGLKPRYAGSETQIPLAVGQETGP